MRQDPRPKKMGQVKRSPAPRVVHPCSSNMMTTTHRLFSGQVTAYSYASTVHEGRCCPIVVEVLKPLCEGEMN